MHEDVFDHEHLSEESRAEIAQFIWAQESVELTTVGIDIGSSTSHLLLARILLQRPAQGLSARFVVTSREVLWRSPIMLTPFLPDGTIDAGALGHFICDSYAAAGLDRGDVDSGAVILTGEAIKKTNAQAIDELFAEEVGKFVCATAGHKLECILAAHGSGAVALSRDRAELVLHVDIGGGTTKLALIENGTILFSARAGKGEYFSGEGNLITERPGNHMWETNFVPDLEAIELKSWGDRGAGGTNIMVVLADGLMHAHISEMPMGTYKKGHRHGPGFHVMCVVGEGFSLLWYDNDQDFRRIDWKHGVVFPPSDRQFHQHFNISPQPARYLATAVGGLRHPFTVNQRRSLLGAKPGEKAAVSVSQKEGGDQIEYEDQDPRIHQMWLEALKKNNVAPRMEKYITA